MKRLTAQRHQQPALTVGGVWRFRKDQVERWVEERTERS